MSKKIDELLQVLDIGCICYKETCDKCLAKHEIDRRLKRDESVREYLESHKKNSIDLEVLYNFYYKENKIKRMKI